MNYNSFLTRDCKSIGQNRKPSRPRLSHLHVALIATSVVAIGSVMAFISFDARATKTTDDNTAIALNTTPLTLLHIGMTVPEASEEVSATEELETGTQQAYELDIRPGHTLAGLFRQYQISSTDLHQIMHNHIEARILRNLQAGNKLSLVSNEAGNLVSLEYQIDKTSLLQIERDQDQFTVETISKPRQTRVAYTQATIQSSLFESGKGAGLSDSMIMDMAAIFGWDIDFALDIRKGDHFSILYEEHFIDGIKQSNGKILAAEFTNQGNTFRAVRYTSPDGRSEYYSPDGLAMRKAFLRTPVDFSRISSRFGKRFHPILNSTRMHQGVDYAAPQGTPIKASGDGKIVFRGVKGGYGNTIILQHGGLYSTLYAHMSSFRKGLRNGSRVRQGQVIGYVGKTGRATGNHLHYEFRVSGVHRNPLTIKLPSATPVNSTLMDEFKQATRSYLHQLAMLKQVQVAANLGQ